MAQKKRGMDVPGNALESQLAYQRMMLRQAEALARAEAAFAKLELDECWLDGFSIRIPDENRSDYMVIVRAHTPEGAIVAFHNAETFMEVLSGTIARIENRTIKWKEDQYAGR